MNRNSGFSIDYCPHPNPSLVLRTSNACPRGRGAYPLKCIHALTLPKGEGAYSLVVVVRVEGEGVAVPFVFGVGEEDEAAGFALADEPAARDGGAVEFRRVFVVAAFEFLPFEDGCAAAAAAKEEFSECHAGFLGFVV